MIKKTLSDFIEETPYTDKSIRVDKVQEFIEDIVNVCEEEGFGVILKDGEGEDTIVGFSEYIRKRAGGKLIK